MSESIWRVWLTAVVHQTAQGMDAAQEEAVVWTQQPRWAWSLGQRHRPGRRSSGDSCRNSRFICL